MLLWATLRNLALGITDQCLSLENTKKAKTAFVKERVKVDPGKTGIFQNHIQSVTNCVM